MEKLTSLSQAELEEILAAIKAAQSNRAVSRAASQAYPNGRAPAPNNQRLIQQAVLGKKTHSGHPLPEMSW